VIVSSYQNRITDFSPLEGKRKFIYLFFKKNYFL
jgi:hypothetical protein